jgi:hypothetical protein
VKKPHIVFAGKPYGIDSIRKETKASPIISVPASDLKIDEQLVVITGEDASKEIVLYKYEGKMVVLLGVEKAKKDLEEKGTVKGRLLSKQGLKHVAVIDIPVHEQNKQAQAIEQELYQARQQELRERFGDRYIGDRAERQERPNDGMNRLSERVSGMPSRTETRGDVRQDFGRKQTRSF